MLSKRIFYINSRNRISGTDCDFNINIDMGPNPKFNRICAQTVIIPKSYYLVQAGFYTFTLTENKATTITIPAGNYSSSSFIAIIPVLLNLASISLGNTWTYNMFFPSLSDPGTGKFTFIVTGNAGLQPSFTFYNNLFEQFGFPKGTTTFFGDKMISTNIIKFQLEDTIFVHSSLCTNGRDDILEMVSASGADLSTMTHEAGDIMAASKIITTHSPSARFSLTDEDGTALDLNGLNWILKLLVWEQ